MRRRPTALKELSKTPNVPSRAKRGTPTRRVSEELLLKDPPSKQLRHKPQPWYHSRLTASHRRRRLGRGFQLVAANASATVLEGLTTNTAVERSSDRSHVTYTLPYNKTITPSFRAKPMLRHLTCLLMLSGLLFTGCNPPATNDPTTPASPETNPNATPDKPEVVSKLEETGAKTRKDGNGNIIEVDLRKMDVTNDLLAQLAGLPKLRSVLLADTKVTDASLEAIGKIPTIENLDLRGCAITNAGMPYLSGLTKLKALKFNGKNGLCKIDDDGLDALANLPNLKVLAFDSVWVGADGLAKLLGAKEIIELYLADTLVDDDTLPVLLQFPKLQKLRISQTQVSDEGLAVVAKMNTLIELDLSENSLISDQGMQHVAKLKNLKKLNLWRLELTDTGIGELAGLANLEWFNVDNTKLSDDGLPAVKGMTKLTFLHLGSTGISDEGLVHLEGLTSLKDLKVTRTAVTAEGVTKLQKKLTDTEIQLKYEG